jgi:hypothetical protein
MTDSLVEAMGRMFDARLLAEGGHGPRRDQEDHHREESRDENSGFGVEDMVVVVVLISIISVVVTVLISIISVADVVHTSVV